MSAQVLGGVFIVFTHVINQPSISTYQPTRPSYLQILSILLCPAWFWSYLIIWFLSMRIVLSLICKKILCCTLSVEALTKVVLIDNVRLPANPNLGAKPQKLIICHFTFRGRSSIWLLHSRLLQQSSRDLHQHTFPLNIGFQKQDWLLQNNCMYQLYHPDDSIDFISPDF